MKTGTAFRMLKIDQVTPDPDPYGKPVFYSRIRLQGKWLAEAGFKAGQHVRVYITQGKVTLMPV